MSYLDELKKQAQDKSTQSAEQQSKTLQKHEINWHRLAPKAYQIFNYLKDLAATLNDVKPQSLCTFGLNKTIEIKNLKQQNFRVARNDKESIRSFSFRFDFVGDRDFQLVMNNIALSEKMKHLLTEHVITFSEKMESQNRIEFTIKPRITAHFDYSADVVNNVFMLRIHNFEGTWSQTIRLPPDSISDALMDETAKYILRQPNKFMAMVGYTVPDELRAKLQEQLQRGKNPQPNPPQEGQSGKPQQKFLGLFKK